MSRTGSVLWRAFLWVGAAAVAVYFVLPHGLVQNTLYNALSLAAAVALFAGARLHRPSRRLPWYLLAVGQLLFTVGDQAWDFFEFVRHINPFPSMADVFFLAGYPFLGLGVLLVVRSRNPRRDRGGLIDAVIVATGVGLLSWIFLMLPYANDPSLSLLEKVVSIAYPLMDVLLLALVARLLVGQDDRAPAFRFLGLSLAAMLVADAAFAALALGNAYADGNLIDAGWLLSFVFLGAAGLHPSMRELSTRVAETPKRLTRKRLALLAGASLMAPTALAIQAARGEHRGELVIAVGSAVLFLLVLVRMSGLVRDVESNRDELDEQGARLREAEARYRTVVEHIPAITFVQEVDRETRQKQTVYVSPQVEAILGLPPRARVASKPWLDLLHPDDRARVLSAEQRRLAGGRPIPHEYRVVTPDGRTVWLHDETVLIGDEPGLPRVWQGVLFDVTAHKLAEEALRNALKRERDAAIQLRALDEMKTTFLHAVSHELRTPLATIMGVALTLERHDLSLSTEDRLDLIRRLAANARKLARLLSDLLDLDRLDRGMLDPKRVPTDMRQLLARVVHESDLAADHVVEVEATSFVASIDPSKVERIVENLLLNAVRHTPVGTRVWVWAEPKDEGVLIAVDDAGPGVPADLREEIFGTFVRGPKANGHSAGVGIGLSLVARFAEFHGGRAWVEDRPGGGASFRVFLPATLGHEREVEAPATPSELPV